MRHRLAPVRGRCWSGKPGLSGTATGASPHNSIHEQALASPFSPQPPRRTRIWRRPKIRIWILFFPQAAQRTDSGAWTRAEDLVQALDYAREPILRGPDDGWAAHRPRVGLRSAQRISPLRFRAVRQAPMPGPLQRTPSPLQDPAWPLPALAGCRPTAEAFRRSRPQWLDFDLGTSPSLGASGREDAMRFGPRSLADLESTHHIVSQLSGVFRLHPSSLTLDNSPRTLLAGRPGPRSPRILRLSRRPSGGHAAAGQLESLRRAPRIPAPPRRNPPSDPRRRPPAPDRHPRP